MTPIEAAAQLHELKCWPEYFRAMRDGRKLFEVRLNDRDFREGDALVLREWDPDTKQYTGHQLRVHVTFVLPGGKWGIDRDHVVMGLRYDCRHEKAMTPVEAAAEAMCVSWGYSADHDPNDDQTVAPDGEETTYCPRPSMQQFRDAARAAVLAFLEAAANPNRRPYAPEFELYNTATAIAALTRMAKESRDD